MHLLLESTPSTYCFHNQFLDLLLSRVGVAPLLPIQKHVRVHIKRQESNEDEQLCSIFVILFGSVFRPLYSRLHMKRRLPPPPLPSQQVSIVSFISYRLARGPFIIFHSVHRPIVDTVATFELGPTAPLYCLMAGLKNMFLRGCDVGGRLRH